ncbi:MAG: sugar ABC transporter permease [Ruminococcaceae bacterium]|nr:sugar ABC transporter permease [Oscillospiraceae bacterium]
MTVGYRARRRTANATIYFLLAVLGILWVLPIVYLVILSLRGESGAYLPYLLPKNWSLDNYRRLFTDTTLFNYPRWYMNTLIVSVCTCLLSTLLVLSVSYTFSRLRFSSRRKFMNTGLILGMFPGFMTMIAVYHLLKVLGLAQSLVALILVYSAGSCMGYFIAKGYFDTIPRSLDEAATLDGATRHQIFFRITLPMSTPILAYTALTAFMVPWTDFIFVSVIMKDNYQNYTLALGLYQMVTKENIYRYFTAFCAGSVLVAIPVTLLFLRLQKYYVEGVTGGAVKG